MDPKMGGFSRCCRCCCPLQKGTMEIATWFCLRCISIPFLYIFAHFRSLYFSRLRKIFLGYLHHQSLWKSMRGGPGSMGSSRPPRLPLYTQIWWAPHANVWTMVSWLCALLRPCHRVFCIWIWVHSFESGSLTLWPVLTCPECSVRSRGQGGVSWGPSTPPLVNLTCVDGVIWRRWLLWQKCQKENTKNCPSFSFWPTMASSQWVAIMCCQGGEGVPAWKKAAGWLKPCLDRSLKKSSSRFPKNTKIFPSVLCAMCKVV